MKITKRQLRRIIKEEKAKLAEYGDYTQDALEPRYPRPDKKTGNPAAALGNLHTAIDNLIKALGNEEAYLELQGIVEEWQ